MIPFDGEFAQKTILPLCYTAYDAVWNDPNAPWNQPVGAPNPVLAGFTNIAEVLVDTTDPDFQKMAFQKLTSDKSHMTLARMRAPVGANLPPTALDLAAAEGGAAADFDAPPGVANTPPTVLAAPVPLNDRFGWVCRDGDRLIITFRGTQTPGDWLHNLDFIGEPYLPVPGRGTVHQGFQLVYYAIRKNLIDIVRKLAPGCTELIITGHSLGASLATLAMPDILNQYPTLSPTLYNLASPRTGHDDFQNYFDSHVNVCYRVVNQWDVVPHVPPALAGYVHVGNQLTIDSGFNFDVAHNHVLSAGYMPGIIQWNHNHPVTQTPKLGSFGLGALVGVSA